jgi:DNA repair protein SbcD/Mre11
MLIAHLADLHLGYRAYHRMAPGGLNQRERDVADALARAVEQVVAAEPDLVVVAGDVFHTVRPSNAAIMEAFRQFMRVRRGLPRAPVVIIAGNHDAPRSTDNGSILRLLAEIPEVHVVDDVARAVRLEAPDASVLCLPHPALARREAGPLEPDPAAAVNVLMLHGTVSGTGVDEQLLRMVEYGGAHIDREALREESWDYIALGHYHNATRVASNMWYAGATERTAPNLWAEADTRKGWVLYDTDLREGEFREIVTREVVELPRFSARARGAGGAGNVAGAGNGAGGGTGPGGGGTGVDEWLAPETIDARVRDAVALLPGGVAGKVVRQVIADVPRELFRQLDHRQIRALKAEAVHFQLEARRPDVGRAVATHDSRRRTLEEELALFLAGWQTTTPGIDRDRLVALGEEYLAAAGADEPTMAPESQG